MLDPGKGSRFIMGRVSAVDTTAKTPRCQTLGGERELRYDQLVFAFGNRARLDLIPGMAEHALPLKTVGDAMHIRNVVLRRLVRIELEYDTATRLELGHFVVIGGGFSGVEVAGELVDCLASIRRFYPRVARHELRVTVLHDQDRLLPAWLLWRAYYLSQMPTLRRKLRIYVEWTWGMFFPADITHLRFTRSEELQTEEQG